MPEEKGPMDPLKAGTINDIRRPVQDGCQDGFVVGGVIFQVRILNNHDIPRGVGNGGPDGSALTPVFIVLENFAAGDLQGFQELGSFVGRAVVHNDDLPFEPQQFNGLNFFQELEKGFFLVVDGNNDG